MWSAGARHLVGAGVLSIEEGAAGFPFPPAFQLAIRAATPARE